MVADTSITNAKLGSSAVTYDKINFGGAGHGVWWEEIGRITLVGSGDSISITSLAARTYLMIFYQVTATAGNLAPLLRFNNDTAANYASRYSANGAADTTAVSATSLVAGTSGVAVPQIGQFYLNNVATTEKIVQGLSTTAGAAGAATAPSRLEVTGKWANTAAQISRIDLINTDTGDFAIGSELVILGHN